MIQRLALLFSRCVMTELNILIDFVGIMSSYMLNDMYVNMLMYVKALTYISTA